MLLVAVTLCLFYPVRHYDFVNYDDGRFVQQAEVQAGLTRDGVLWAFTTAEFGWHPITWLSHMVDSELYGDNPGAHHLTSVFIHAASSLLLFLVLMRMTGDLWPSGLTAALFALHPLRVESVAWVAERKDVLSAFFWILAMWGYVRYVERPTVGRYVVTAVAMGLELMSKGMAVTLPFVFLLLDYWPLKRLQLAPRPALAATRKPKRGRRLEQGSRTTSHRAHVLRLVVEKIPFFLLAVGGSVAAVIAQRSLGAVAGLGQIPLAYRIENALVSYVAYIGMLLWPVGLAVYYPHPLGSLPAWKVAGSVLILLTVSGLAIMAAKRRPYFIVGWLWYLGTLVPVIGIIQVGGKAMADRYTYLPSIGLFVLVAWGIQEVVSGVPRRRVAMVIVTSCALVGFTAATWLQLQHWRNSETLFRHALAVTTRNSIAHGQLGAALADSGRPEEAIPHYEAALRIYGTDAAVQANLGQALDDVGRPEEGLPHLFEAVRLDPNLAQAQARLGAMLAEAGRFAEAIEHLTKAVVLDPNNAQTHNNLGAALLHEDNVQAAIEQFSAAIRISPDYGQALFNLALAQLQQGHPREAADSLRRVMKLGESNPDLAPELEKAEKLLQEASE